ncbi:hypothetical protein ACIQRW_31675 [Streptomyces sp. NPDC091287]|uniref:hypothetical protein n=1 Tax=Streptomyces sp. NPDC091287 TaxID=3365988 RepID=UPI0037F77943
MAATAVGALAANPHGDAVGGLSVSDIATIWQLPKGTVYWLASKHSWRRYRASGRAYYHAEDVMDTITATD